MKKLTLRAILALIVFTCCQNRAFSQFSISESFQNNTVSNGISLSGSAYLTSGTVDPEGDGWLRLTNSVNYQAGSAIIQQSFPSAMGVLIDFEYTAWSNPGAGNGADGIAFFLFNADSLSKFRNGGYGGSLGYAQRTDTGGIPGGYMGIGLDEYGNYSNPTEGRLGGIGFIKNAVVLRGPAPTYDYLSGNQVISSDAGAGDNGGIDYNTTCNTRPTADQFYRRVQVVLQPDNGSYTVTVKWKKSQIDSFTTLFGPVTMATPPPANLILGLSGATGDSHNYHEIRNLRITTPGNLSVNMEAPTSIPNAPTPANLNYDVTIQNLTEVRVNDIQLEQLLPQDYILDPANITIDQYGNLSDSVYNITVNNNVLTGVASLAANAEITLHLNGTISNPQLGQTYMSTVKVNAGSIQDIDTTNNFDTAYTSIQSPLPVKLNFFTAVRQQGDVNLMWETAMEIDNDHFDIERSQDGKTFTTIGTVKGKQTTSTVKEYQFKDRDVAKTGATILFYRLLQVDKSGHSDYSSIKSIRLDNKSGASISAFPVPFTNNITLNLDNSVGGNASVNLYNTAGQKIYHLDQATTSGSNVIQLKHLQTLPAGSYILECVEANRTSTLKITK